MSSVSCLPQESARLCALHDYGVLDTPPEAAFDELVANAARICGTQNSCVSFVDEDRQWFKARHGITVAETPRVGSFFTHAIAQPDEILVVPDASLDPRFSDNPLVIGESGIRFYAGVPLRTPNGYAVGMLCVSDRQPHLFSPDLQATLRFVGHQVVTQLELRRSLHQTRLSDTRLENSQRIAGLGDWEYDFVDHRLIWSEEVYRILGVARHDSPPNSEAFYRRVHPDDLAFVHREKKAAAEGTRRVDFEHRIVRPGGEVRHIHQVVEMIFDAEGRQLREWGTIQDITDRKRSESAVRRSEERFKFVARAVSDVVWDWDISADTLWWNDGFLTAFGFGINEITPSVEAWTSRIHPDERTRVVDSIRHAIDAGAETWGAEYRCQRKGGSYAYVQDRGYILRDASGGAVRMVGGMRNLTEQKKLEAQHQRAQRMESIGTLAAGIAHDLNNVLTPIMISIELLKSDLCNQANRNQILDTIHVTCSHGAELVRQILSFGRGLDGKRVPIRLGCVIDDLLRIITESFPHNIRIVAKVPTDLWPITGDPSQLDQVLLNLAVNARDAMPEGGMLTVAASNVILEPQHAHTCPDAKAGVYVLLLVTDTGQGIPPEIRERIFEPFFTTKGIGKGTGIGLATVHTVVMSHGGFLNVESKVGLGTTFQIYLPAHSTQRIADTVHPFQTDLPRGRDELVLVVDDEFSIREITKQTLEAFGYRVLTAGNGAEAVAHYSKQPQQIALVITDKMMPVMDGTTAIKELTRINSSVKIIAASGLDDPAEIAKASDAGVRDFLPKPYTAQTLLRLVREVIDRPPQTIGTAKSGTKHSSLCLAEGLQRVD